MWGYWIHSPGVAAEGTLSVYGGLYVKEGSTGQTMNIAVSKLTGFTDISETRHLTVSIVNSNILISEPGIYIGIFTASFLGTANMEFKAHLYINNVEQDAGLHRKISGGDRGSASFTITPRTLSVGDVIDVRGSSNSDGDSITLIDAQFVLFRIG